MTKQTRKIAILGAGSWGTALASTFSMNGNQVILWGKTKAILMISIKIIKIEGFFKKLFG